MAFGSRPRREPSTADAGGGVRWYSVALLDLTKKTDQQLRHARTHRIVAIAVFTVVFAVGIVLLATSLTVAVGYLGIALTVLGGLNMVISGGGLWRVSDEGRMRAAERRARAAAAARTRPAEKWEFRER